MTENKRYVCGDTFVEHDLTYRVKSTKLVKVPEGDQPQMQVVAEEVDGDRQIKFVVFL